MCDKSVMVSRWLLTEHDGTTEEQRPTVTCSLGESSITSVLCENYPVLTRHVSLTYIYLLQMKNGMDATFFGFRWITLLLSQEFLLPGNPALNHTHSYSIQHVLIM